MVNGDDRGDETNTEATAVVNTQATIKTARCTGVQTRHDEDGAWVAKAAAARQEQAVERLVRESVIKAVTEQQHAWDKHDHYCEVEDLRSQIRNLKVNMEDYEADGVESLPIICKLAKNQHMTSSEQKYISRTALEYPHDWLVILMANGQHECLE